MPDAGVVATLLLLVGLFLLGLEFFIPSFGMIFTLAAISLVVSFWAACQAWYGTNPLFFWTYVFTGGLGIPGSLLGAIWLMQRTSLGKRIILQGPERVKKRENPLQQLVGAHGESHTVMAPGGIVVIERNRYHAETVGMIIDPQTPISVVGVKGNRLVVRPRDESETPPESPATAKPEVGAATDNTVIDPQATETGTADASAASSDGTDHLDFDIPED